MSFQDRLGCRRKAYKSTVDSVDSRRRREDEAIQIGRRDKDDQVARRRRLAEISADLDEDVSCINNLSADKGTQRSVYSQFFSRRPCEARLRP